MLVDVFHNGAPSTIMKRYRRMSTMTISSKTMAEFFCVTSLSFKSFFGLRKRERCATSRLKGYIEAVIFCFHELELWSSRD